MSSEPLSLIRTEQLQFVDHFWLPKLTKANKNLGLHVWGDAIVLGWAQKKG